MKQETIGNILIFLGICCIIWAVLNQHLFIYLLVLSLLFLGTAYFFTDEEVQKRRLKKQKEFENDLPRT